MKELSIEEKAKCYDEAIKRAKVFKEHLLEINDKGYIDEMDYIFPELKESEDERIRKELLVWLKSRDGQTLPIDRYNAAIAWLEKQGEHQEYPKDVIDNAISFLANRNDGMPEKEAKDIVNAIITVLNPSYWTKQGEQKPSWSEEDEENLKWFEKFFRAESVISGGKDIPQDRYLWFKNLKDRVQPQPKQEWSEEDKKLIDDTCHLINTLASGYGEKVTEPITFSGTQMIASIKDRLRALVDNRPQSHWKPNDEQMENLSRASNGGVYRTSLLMELYQDLKKLREE